MRPCVSRKSAAGAPPAVPTLRLYHEDWAAQPEHVLREVAAFLGLPPLSCSAFGHYAVSLGDASACVDCAAGEFQSSPNATACEACDAGGWCGAGASSVTLCDAGTHRNSTGGALDEVGALSVDVPPDILQIMAAGICEVRAGAGAGLPIILRISRRTNRELTTQNYKKAERKRIKCNSNSNKTK